MSDIGAETRATATLHLTIRRANGTVEEIDLPASTELTKADIQALIARQQAGER